MNLNEPVVPVRSSGVSGPGLFVSVEATRIVANPKSVILMESLESSSKLPARGVEVARLGPNGLKIEKETSHDLLSWRRRASMA